MQAIDQILLRAIRDDHSVNVRRALAGGANPNLRIDGVPLIAILACQGRTALVESLLAMKGDPNLRDDRGRTALMYLAQFGESMSQTQLATDLVNAGGNPRAVDAQGHDALAIARMHLNPVMSQFLSGVDERRPSCPELTIRIFWGLPKSTYVNDRG